MRTLRFGSQGPDVEWLQKKLGLVDDGDFGQKTYAAVVDFQQKNGLVPDGVVGARTWAVLKPGSNPPAPEGVLIRGSFAWYENWFKRMTYDRGFEKIIREAAERVARGKARYQTVAANVGLMPWYDIGAFHHMEAGCNFAGVLHNGEHIIGTGRKTTLVPAGRGPFSTWEEAAIDALKLKNYHLQTSWTLGEQLSRAEKFNGMGVFNYHPAEMTAYVWSQSSVNDDTGKYVRDSVWSETANANGQTGFAVILKEMDRLGIIKLPEPPSPLRPAA